MNKKNRFILISSVLICFTILIVGKNIFALTKTDTNKKIILIDPGHGGIDGGAVSKNGTIEKDINLKISLNLKKKLEDLGMKVVMTRDTDKGLYSDNGTIRNKKVEDLKNRCKMKKESNCDMFISIHLNTFTSSKYYGAQIWYSDREDSKKLANIIQSNIKVQLDQTNKRVEKPAKNHYRIFRENNDMPSVLVECGFISNPMEENKLKDDKYQDKIAEVILKSVKDYYNDNK